MTEGEDGRLLVGMDFTLVPRALMLGAEHLIPAFRKLGKGPVLRRYRIENRPVRGLQVVIDTGSFTVPKYNDGGTRDRRQYCSGGGNGSC